MDGSVTQRIKHVFECSKWEDIEFQVEDDENGKFEVIGAHRLILASCSPVFEALCYGPLAEKSLVSVSDISSIAFRTMLEYLYTDTLKIPSVDVAFNLLYAGKKYLLKNMSKSVSKYLCDNVNDTNCFELYNLSCICEDENLRMTSWDYIRVHLDSAEKHASGEIISTELLTQLVNETKMNAKEVTIVKIAYKWAENQCRRLELQCSMISLRNVLMQYNIFQKIHWHMLCLNDFATVCPGLLTEEEISSIKNTTNISSPAPVENVRVKLPLRMVYVHRFGEGVVRRSPIREGLTLSTVVTPNRPVMLHSFYGFAKCSPLGFQFGNINTVRQYIERLTYSIVDEEGHVLQESHAFRREVEYDLPFKIALPTPLPLDASKSYDIRINLHHSIGDYQCVVRNSCAKVPSGYFVNFCDRADINIVGDFVNTPDISFISGLECSS